MAACLPCIYYYCIYSVCADALLHLLYPQPFEGRGLHWAWELDRIAAAISRVHRVMKHWGEVLPKPVLTVHYEALVTDIETVARRVLEHCGLPWDPAVLAFHSADVPVQTASVDQVRQRLYSTSIGRWRRYAKELEGVRDVLIDLVTDYEAEVEGALRAAGGAPQEEAAWDEL